MVGSAGNAPVRRFRLCFLTPDLQSGSRTPPGGNAEGRMENEEIRPACRYVAIWRAALVLPQARRVLETQLRKLARGAAILHSSFCLLHLVWCGCRESHPDGGRAQALYLARRHSAVQSQPRKLKGPEAFLTLPARVLAEPTLGEGPAFQQRTNTSW